MRRTRESLLKIDQSCDFNSLLSFSAKMEEKLFCHQYIIIFVATNRDHKLEIKCYINL